MASVITSAPWHPGQWPHAFVPGSGTSIEGFVISNTGGGGGGGGGGTTAPFASSKYLVNVGPTPGPINELQVSDAAANYPTIYTVPFVNTPYGVGDAEDVFDNNQGKWSLQGGTNIVIAAEGYYLFTADILALYTGATSGMILQFMQGTMFTAAPILAATSEIDATLMFPGTPYVYGAGFTGSTVCHCQPGDSFSVQMCGGFGGGGGTIGIPLVSNITITAVEGAQGPTGAPGPVGPTGPAGPQGLPGDASVLPEEFSIAKSGDWINPGGLGEAIPVPGWTDVLDPVVHPLTRPNQLYINTNYGTLDLAAGTFTAGKEGVYTYHLHLVSENETVSQQAYAGISVNYVDVTNPGLLQTSIPTIEDWSAYPVSTSPLIADIGQVYLNVGDVVRVVASFDVYDYASEVFPVDNNSYKLNLWSMSYASSIPGPAGPAGANATPLPGEGFCITLLTDWTNPDGTGTNFNHLTNWTATPFAGDYTEDVTSLFYNTVSTTGTLDLAAGTFTVGKTGLWFVSTTSYPLAADFAGGSPSIQYPIGYNHRIFIYLTAGQVITCNSQYPIVNAIDGPAPGGPNEVWQMVCLEGLVGPAGATGPAGPAGPSPTTTTLTSAGGTSLVNAGTGPALAIKGLAAGTGITITDTGNSLSISSPAGTVTTLGTVGGGTSLVNDGLGPTLATKSLYAGTGVTFSSSATSVTINATNSGGTVTSIQSISPQIIPSPANITLAGTLDFRAIGFNAYLPANEVVSINTTIATWSTAASPPQTWTSGFTPVSGVAVLPYTGPYLVSARIASPDTSLLIRLTVNGIPTITSAKTEIGTYSYNTINAVIYGTATGSARLIVDDNCTISAVDTPALPFATYGRATWWSMIYLGST